MANVGAVISSIRNIMRQDRGISGDAQRLEQLGWMLFLKIMDDKDQELEVIKDNYVSVIPEKFQWRNWASNPEGITGDELINFIDSNELTNKGLFLSLRELKSTTNPKRAMIVKEVFDGTNNYMKSGYEMRKVINKLNEIDFTKSEDKHVFGNIYESILQELRDAGNKGEYYTPRAVTQLMTMMTDPKLGEKVLDPAAGTGGFLTAAIDHVRENYVKTVDDEAVLQTSITGWELKPVAYVLGLTNLILHEIDVPDYHYIDSLKKEYNSIGKKDQVDVILANPPFGASIADGVETNFPSTYRCKESADLFVILMLQLLKPNGRCAIVLPDGSITGEGVKARIREKLLTDCNLHTIVRLPQSTFFPALVYTNLLFFEKGEQTKEIWYYEHSLPEGQKSYSKTKPIQFSEFNPLIEWWYNRTENEVAWKVSIDEVNNWDLDIKNPNKKNIVLDSSDDIYVNLKKADAKITSLTDELFNDVLHNYANPIFNEIVHKRKDLVRNVDFVKQLRQVILQEGIQGKLTESWRSNNKNLESATELLKRIKVALEKKQKKSKKSANSKISEIDIPFEIPENWVWCRLDEVVEIHMGQSPEGDSYNKNGDGFPFYQGKTEFGVMYPVGVRVWCNQPKKISQINDILISVRAPVGDVNISDKEYAIGRGLSIIRVIDKTINPLYLFYFLDCIKRNWKAKGSFFDAINRDIIEARLFPLPPLEEQHALVERIENLLSKCTELQSEIENLNSHNKALLKALFNETFETKMEVCQD